MEDHKVPAETMSTQPPNFGDWVFGPDEHHLVSSPELLVVDFDDFDDDGDTTPKPHPVSANGRSFLNPLEPSRAFWDVISPTQGAVSPGGIVSPPPQLQAAQFRAPFFAGAYNYTSSSPYSRPSLYSSLSSYPDPFASRTGAGTGYANAWSSGVNSAPLGTTASNSGQFNYAPISSSIPYRNVNYPMGNTQGMNSAWGSPDQARTHGYSYAPSPMLPSVPPVSAEYPSQPYPDPLPPATPYYASTRPVSPASTGFSYFPGLQQPYKVDSPVSFHEMEDKDDEETNIDEYERSREGSKDAPSNVYSTYNAPVQSGSPVYSETHGTLEYALPPAIADASAYPSDFPDTPLDFSKRDKLVKETRRTWLTDLYTAVFGYGFLSLTILLFLLGLLYFYDGDLQYRKMAEDSEGFYAEIGCNSSTSNWTLVAPDNNDSVQMAMQVPFCQNFSSFSNGSAIDDVRIYKNAAIPYVNMFFIAACYSVFILSLSATRTAKRIVRCVREGDAFVDRYFAFLQPQRKAKAAKAKIREMEASHSSGQHQSHSHCRHACSCYGCSTSPFASSLDYSRSTTTRSLTPLFETLKPVTTEDWFSKAVWMVLMCHIPLVLLVTLFIPILTRGPIPGSYLDYSMTAFLAFACWACLARFTSQLLVPRAGDWDWENEFVEGKGSRWGETRVRVDWICANMWREMAMEAARGGRERQRPRTMFARYPLPPLQSQ
jgi:hypothetical protein